MLRTLSLTLMFCLSCKSDGGGNALSVDLRTDLVGGVEVGQVTVLDEVGSMPGVTATLAVDVSTPLLRGVRVARFDGLTEGEHTITARLFAPDGSQIAERRVVATVRGETVSTVVFTRSCLSVTCPSVGATECINGECVPPECSPENLDACGTNVCADASECPASTTACATASCEEGACLLLPIEGACATSEICVPDRGCVPDALDGGTDDAGTADVGPADVGPADSGARDRDGDGVPDAVDNCPDDANATQHDEDADSIGDACDLCPHVLDPAQPDADADGVGDACDPDPAVGGNRIVSFFSFETDDMPAGWTAEVEAGAPWRIVDGDLVITTANDDVARFTMTPTPDGELARVETAYTIDGIAPFVSGYQYRSIAIIDDAVGTPTSDDATFVGLIQNVETLTNAYFELLSLRAGRTMTSIHRTLLTAPLAVGDRHSMRYSRAGDQRTGTLALPMPRTVTGVVPVVGGGIGLRVRGLSVRFHHLVVIR